jgi:hypothetical protein
MNPFKWFFRIFKELRQWYTLYKITTKEKVIIDLYSHKLNVDWVGRIYTTVNVPEEYLQHQQTIQSYVLSKLRDYDLVLTKLNLNDLVYPEIFSVKDNILAYNVILKTNSDAISFLGILSRSIVLYIIYKLGFISYPYIINYIIPLLLTLWNEYQ